MASTRASRWPSDRSRGCARRVDVAGQSLEPGQARAGLGAGLVVGGLTLGADGRPVEQVARRLRHQRDQRRASAGPTVAGSVPSTSTVPPLRRPEPCSAHSSDDLPEPLRPMSATTSPPARSRSTSRTATRSPYRTDSRRARSTVPATGPGVGDRTYAVTAARRRRASRSRSGAGPPPGVADRQRQRRPAGEPAELDDRRRHVRGRQHVGRRAVANPAVGADREHPVGVLHDPLEPVLGDQRGDAEVVDEPGDRGQHVLGRGRVERRGRLVEHEHLGVRGQHRADRDPLLLPAGELVQRPAAQVGEPRAGRASPRPACA